MTVQVELDIKGDVEVLRLQPGDKIVVTLERELPMLSIEALRASLKERFPDHELIVLSPKIKLSIQCDEVAA